MGQKGKQGADRSDPQTTPQTPLSPHSQPPNPLPSYSRPSPPSLVRLLDALARAGPGGRGLGGVEARALPRGALVLLEEALLGGVLMGGWGLSISWVGDGEMVGRAGSSIRAYIRDPSIGPPILL